MSHSIDTAIVPVGGSGTRCFPITTYLDKFLIPVAEPKPGSEGLLLRPALAFILDEFAGAGIRRIIFVTTKRGKGQFNDGFLELNPLVREFLEAQGKTRELQEELDRRAAYKSLFEFDFVFQNPEHGYGTTVPLWLAKEKLQGVKNFAYWGGDDFIYHQDGTSEMKFAIDAYLRQGTDHAVVGLPVARELASNYGVFITDEKSRLTAWREKPKDNIPEQPLINATRWLFSEDIWPLVEKEMQTDRKTGHYGSEHQLTYVVNGSLEAGQTFFVHEASPGHRYCEVGDAGSKKKTEATLEAYPRFVDIISEKIKSKA
jgi:UTP-glucose-1-phosphate uridylyltransferase